MPRFTVCLTFDFDAISGWITTVKTRNPSMLSRGEFGAFAIPRILELLARYGIRSSFAVPGHTAYAYPDEVRMIRDAGHEILHHGWMHENPSELDEAAERRVLERGLEALQAVAGVVPAGYRSPAWDMSPRTRALLLDYGFSYDSSFMGKDFHPYYLRDGDVVSQDGPYVFGREIELVEMPVAWHLDDFPYLEFSPGFPAHPPSVAEEIWRGEFDWGYAHVPGGVMTITLHPQVIGRGHRMLMLERVIRHFTDHEGVAFDTLGDVARLWKSENPWPGS